MARKDPGAYVHNGRYIIKLLHDSIEDLNGVISMPVDMSAADRDAPGHFNGASDAARHWDEDEAVAASCSKCHSGATGFRFLTEFGVGVEVPETANGLECYTCHDNFGNSYDVIEVESTVYSGGAEAEHDGFDNICATCHSGRQSGATVDAAIAAGQLGFRNVHYLPAAGIRNGNETGVGYEYPARDYAGFLQHDSRTQCAGCHDPVESNHTFRIADVWSGICDGCHSDQDGADEIRMVHLDDYDGDGAAPHSRLAIADIWHRPPGTSSCRLEDARTGARHVCGFVTISRTTCLPGWSCSWSRCRCASGLRSPPGHRSSLA